MFRVVFRVLILCYYIETSSLRLNCLSSTNLILNSGCFCRDQKKGPIQLFRGSGRCKMGTGICLFLSIKTIENRNGINGINYGICALDTGIQSKLGYEIWNPLPGPSIYISVMRGKNCRANFLLSKVKLRSRELSRAK